MCIISGLFAAEALPTYQEEEREGCGSGEEPTNAPPQHKPPHHCTPPSLLVSSTNSTAKCVTACPHWPLPICTHLQFTPNVLIPLQITSSQYIFLPPKSCSKTISLQLFYLIHRCITLPGVRMFWIEYEVASRLLMVFLLPQPLLFCKMAAELPLACRHTMENEMKV